VTTMSPDLLDDCRHVLLAATLELGGELSDHDTTPSEPWPVLLARLMRYHRLLDEIGAPRFPRDDDYAAKVAADNTATLREAAEHEREWGGQEQTLADGGHWHIRADRAQRVLNAWG
jgi:hypothetical protein